MIIVIEPGQRSVQTARTIRRLAAEIHIARVGVVVNKVTSPADVGALVPNLEGLPVLGSLSYAPDIARADLEGRSPYTGKDPQASEIRAILQCVEKWIVEPCTV
jgi:CO dehydrogenase maturation factor